MTKVLIVLLIILLFACQCSAPPVPMTPTAIVPQPVTLTPSPVATMTAIPSPTLAPTNTAIPTLTNTPLPTETATAVPATVEPTPTPTVAPSPVATVAPNYYIVQRDDWLIKIAQFLYGGQYGWEWECLYEANRAVIGENPHLIYRGMKLEHIRECGG